MMTTTDPGPRKRPRKPAFDKATATWRLLVVLIAIGAGALARMALPGAGDRPATIAAPWDGVMTADLRALTEPTLADANGTLARPTIVVVRRSSAAPVARTRAS